MVSNLCVCVYKSLYIYCLLAEYTSLSADKRRCLEDPYYGYCLLYCMYSPERDYNCSCPHGYDINSYSDGDYSCSPSGWGKSRSKTKTKSILIGAQISLLINFGRFLTIILVEFEI